MEPSPDVLVVGGGIIGLTSAFALALAGRSVVVLDRQPPGREASWAGAGIIPPGNSSGAATPIDRLRARSVSQFQQFSDELRARTGIDNGYLRCGGVEFLSDSEADVVELWSREGIRYERVGAAALRAQEPTIHAPEHHNIYLLPDCAQVRNPWHLRALIVACEQLGVRFKTGVEVVGWQTRGSQVLALRSADGSSLTAGAFLIAAGAWAESLLAPLGCRPGIRPIRGQIVLYRAARLLFSPVLMFGKRYLVPRADGRVLVGSTEEPEAGFEKANTPAGVADLQRFAHELVPGLAEARVEKTWAGLRPGSPDGLPFVGVVPGTENVFAAVGHARAGVQLSLGTAEMVARLLMGREPEDAAAFRLDRVPDPMVRAAFRS